MSDNQNNQEKKTKAKFSIVREMEDQLKNLQKNINTIQKKDNKSVNAKILKLKGESNEMFGKIKEEIDELEKEIDTSGSTSDVIKTDVDQLGSKINKLETDNITDGTELESLEEQIESMFFFFL